MHTCAYKSVHASLRFWSARHANVKLGTLYMWRRYCALHGWCSSWFLGPVLFPIARPHLGFPLGTFSLRSASVGARNFLSFILSPVCILRFGGCLYPPVWTRSIIHARLACCGCVPFCILHRMLPFSRRFCFWGIQTFRMYMYEYVYIYTHYILILTCQRRWAQSQCIESRVSSGFTKHNSSFYQEFR